MRKIIYFLITFTIVTIPSSVMAEGQEGLQYFVWGFDFMLVVGGWVLLTKLVFKVISKVRKKEINNKARIITWIFIFPIAIFNFIMYTWDPHPMDGPIDRLVYEYYTKDKVKEFEMEHYLKKNIISNDSVISFIKCSNLKYKLADGTPVSKDSIDYSFLLIDTIYNTFCINAIAKEYNDSIISIITFSGNDMRVITVNNELPEFEK